MTIYLYVKTHNITGLKYMGKTTRDPYIYRGSGLYWKRHLKVYGNDITTTILYSTDDYALFKKVALEYSKKFNIIESKDWANFRNETGDGGFSKKDSLKGHLARSSKGGKKAVELGKVWDAHTAKLAGSVGGKGNKGKPKSESHKEAIREAWKRKKIGSLV